MQYITGAFLVVVMLVTVVSVHCAPVFLSASVQQPIYENGTGGHIKLCKHMQENHQIITGILVLFDFFWQWYALLELVGCYVSFVQSCLRRMQCLWCQESCRLANYVEMGGYCVEERPVDYSLCCSLSLDHILPMNARTHTQTRASANTFTQ